MLTKVTHKYVKFRTVKNLNCLRFLDLTKCLVLLMITPVALKLRLQYRLGFTEKDFIW